MSKSQSRIPRVDSASKIPTFGSKISKIARQTKLPTFKVPSSSLRIPTPISRSSSGAELRRTNLIKGTSYSSSSGNVRDSGFSRVPDDQQLLVNETIDLVKGSSDSLDAPANETYDAAVGDATFLKPADVPQTPCGPSPNSTVTLDDAKSPAGANNETFEVNGGKSRLSVDLAEQLNGTIALSSTMNCEKLLDITSDVNPHLMSMMHDGEAEVPNATKLLCMTTTGTEYEGEEGLGERTLVKEQLEADLPSDEDDGADNDVEMLPVILKGQEGRIQLPPKQRFSFGLDLTECTLDCSIELCDVSNSSSMQHNKSPCNNTKQSSFDESLGILTPDQMKEFLDSTKTSTGSHMQLHLHSGGHKGLGHHHCRVDMTPSPEELPLDTVEVKTDGGDIVFGPETTGILYQESSQAESDPKTSDLLTKSTNSKISNSFIASITSVTSLDTGYQGDGETSRPASRGADNFLGRAQGAWNNGVVQRRAQDPMTDSDFFTESDADDLIHNRGDRRAQIIDGQLFGASQQNGASVPPMPPPAAMEDSCMESSGIFTDAEKDSNAATDLSPDTETQSSNKTTCSQRKAVEGRVSEEKRDSAVGPQTSTTTYSRASTTTSEENEVSNTGKCYSAVPVSSALSDNARQSDASAKARSINASSAFTRKQNARRHDMTPRNTPPYGSRSKVLKTEDQHQNQENNANSHNRKSATPNKWDAVMNKIAENKSSHAIKKNFSDVKSKVFSGLVLKNPPAAAVGVSSSAIKRQLFSAAATTKRDFRTSSTHSEQSDCSSTGVAGSPKAATPKASSVTQRSSKKRDVRLISAQGDAIIKDKLGAAKNGTSPLLKELKNSPPSKKYLSSPKTDDLGSERSSPVQLKHGRSGCSAPVPATKPHLGSLSVAQHQKTANGTSTPQVKSPKSTSNGVLHTPLTQRNGTIILESATVTKKKSPSPATDRKSVGKNGIAASVNHNNNINSAYLPVVVSAPKESSTAKKGTDKRVEQALMKELSQSNKTVETLGTMIQYLVFKLDAFSCPAVKVSYQSTQKALMDTNKFLEDTRATCQTLEATLNDRERYFTAVEEELKQSHKQELSRVTSRYEDIALNKDNQIKNLEALLEAKELELQQKIFHLNSDAMQRISGLEKQLEEAKSRERQLEQQVQELTSKEYELLEKAHSSELEFSEKIRALSVQMEKLKTEAASKESELEERLNLSRDELTVVRQQQQRCTSVSPNKSGDLCRTQVLQDEIESLRCVLDMRQREITDLRKQNQELQISSDDRAAALIKISTLESRVEDLQVQLQHRTEEDQRNMEKLKKLEDLYNQEQKTKSRISMHNEELQYRLKQNSERFSIALSELSRSLHENSAYSSSSHNDPAMFSASLGDNLNVSPPASPVVKGVVEKSDSVSYILEMENEAPEVLASRFVRRAGSFRNGGASSSYEKTSHSPVPKRQRCGLQLSASTTSVQLRRNNSDRSPQNSASAMRVRSKSVTIKTPDTKKAFLAAKKHSSSFQDGPMFMSTPKNNMAHSDQLVEEFEDLDDQVFAASQSFKASRGLITCDTANLTSSATKTELKKLRKPKMAAGEALISGSTSEDSDESLSDNSTPASPESPQHDHAADPREIPNLEDALMQKIRATFSHAEDEHVEEISWSEEGEPDESVV